MTKHGRKPKWTQATAITALQTWAEMNEGRAPRQHELVRSIPALPSNAVLQRMFGGLRGAAIAAGLPPTPSGRPRPTNGNGHHAPVGEAPPSERLEIDDVTRELLGDVEPVVEAPLARLTREIQEAEVTLNQVRPAYVDARDRVLLLRMELIELLQNMNEEDQ